MNLKEVKSYTEGLIKNYFKPKVLKKFDEDTNGNLTFDGNPISAKVSEKQDNAIKVISDVNTPANNGLYAKDLSEEVKRINIAQKTVNELGYDELLNTPFIFTVPLSNAEGAINKVVTLDKSIEGYSFIEIYLAANSSSYKRQTQVIRLKVSDIVYNPTTSEKQDMSTFNIQHALNSTLSIGGDVTMIIKAWFQDADHLYLSTSVNPQVSYWDKYEIKHVIGIKKEIITIDPMNYIDTTQGIEDTPVGHIVEIMDNKETKHYLQCDGSEKTIGTYPHLEQHFREIGTINMFGGDGITTYKLPNIEPKPFAYVSYIPEMTANNAPAPYVASADSIHSSPYQPYMAFNSKEGDAGYCWHSLSATSHWLQIDYGTPKKINSFKMKGRKSYSQWYGQMPTSFKLQGSNDGTNFVDIKSFSGLSWGSSIEVEFTLDEPVEYRYYKLADMKSSSNFICFNKIEYAYDVKKYTFIKYEPTYFIDTINGYEEITELLDTSKDYLFNGLNTTTVLNDLITLKDSIENYDKLEIVGQIIDVNGRVGYIKNESVRVSDLTYNTSNSINECNDLVISTRSTNALFQSDLLFNFKDANTLRVIRIGLYSTATGNTSWQSFRIKSIRGIRHRYTVSSK